MKTADTVIGVLLILLSIAVYVGAGDFSARAVQVYGPEMFPRAVSVLLGLCAVGLILQAQLGRSLKLEETIKARGIGRLAVAIGICLVYLIGLPFLGFLVTTPVFIAAVIVLLGHRKVVVVAPVAIAVTLIAWALFTKLLLVPLPEGRIFTG